MIPEGRLSEVPVTGEFLSPDDLVPVAPPETDTPYDWELGGIALNDPSQGLQVQVWEFYLAGEAIMVKPANGPAVAVYSPGPGVTELSGCFDSNMNPALVWVQGGTVWLRWWNAAIADFSLSTLPALTSPRLTLDDKRGTQDGNRDILLLYIRDGNIYYRMQRQRYQEENFLYPVPQNFVALTRVGMSNVGRLQIELRGTEYCSGGFIDAVGCSNADWCKAPCDTEVWAQAPCAAGNWVAAPCASGDWGQEIFYPCPPIILCPLPAPPAWIALASATGAAPSITQLNGTVELLEDGTFHTGGSSSTIGEALYSGLCNELQRADGEPLRFRLRFISASSGNEFTLQVRFIWRDSAGTPIVSNQFDAGEEYTFSGAAQWNTLDTMELEIGHYYGSAQLDWAFEVWSGGLERD